MTTVDQNTQLRSLRPPRLDHPNREALKNYFDNAWELYELLFSAIKAKALEYVFTLDQDPLSRQAKHFQ